MYRAGCDQGETETLPGPLVPCSALLLQFRANAEPRDIMMFMAFIIANQVCQSYRIPTPNPDIRETIAGEYNTPPPLESAKLLVNK